MDFSQAEAEHHRLRREFEAGALTEEEYNARHEELMVEDEEGRWWTIGADTGQWYVHDGKEWVPGEPPAPEPNWLRDLIARLRRNWPLLAGSGAVGLVVIALAIRAVLTPGTPSGVGQGLTSTSTPGSVVVIATTVTPAPKATKTPTATDTPTNTPTVTATATEAPTATATGTNTPTPTFTPTDTPTNTPTVTATATETPTATATGTNTPTATFMPADTPTATPVAQPPQVASLDPGATKHDRAVTVTIRGQYLGQSTAALLIGPDHQVAASAIEIVDDLQIRCSFDLSGITVPWTQKWTLRVEGPGGAAESDFFVEGEEKPDGDGGEVKPPPPPPR